MMPVKYFCTLFQKLAAIFKIVANIKSCLQMYYKLTDVPNPEPF